MKTTTNSTIGYRKGTSSSGGGGRRGGGGKKGPSSEGWEKGDLVRDNSSDPDELTAKPGKNSKLLMARRERKSKT